MTILPLFVPYPAHPSLAKLPASACPETRRVPTGSSSCEAFDSALGLSFCVAVLQSFETFRLKRSPPPRRQRSWPESLSPDHREVHSS